MVAEQFLSSTGGAGLLCHHLRPQDFQGTCPHLPHSPHGSLVLYQVSRSGEPCSHSHLVQKLGRGHSDLRSSCHPLRILSHPPPPPPTTLSLASTDSKLHVRLEKPPRLIFFSLRSASLWATQHPVTRLLDLHCLLPHSCRWTGWKCAW